MKSRETEQMECLALVNILFNKECHNGPGLLTLHNKEKQLLIFTKPD